MTTLLRTTEAESLPDRLGSALPGAVVLDKGLPQAEQREPLAGTAGSGSHQAGGREGAPFLIASPSGEDMLFLLQDLDVQEQLSAGRLYSGQINPLQHMTRVYELRTLRAQYLDALGWHKEAAMVRERLNREMAA